MERRVTRKKREKGVTLVEMIMVLVLVGIAYAIAAPRIGAALNTLRLNGAAQKISADIRYAREMAISRHETYGIEFDQAGNSYQVFQLSGSVKITVLDPYRGTPFTVDFDLLPEYKGVVISGVNACAGGLCTTQEIRIDAFGRPTDAFNNSFSSPAAIVLQIGSLSKTIQVTHQTSFTELI
jgi:prepilin-type N-terminal cleavage/methylation domain-containing protein